MQQVWRKRWINIGWVALGAVTLVLLGAGVYKKNHKACTGIEVAFDGEGANFFIDEKGVAAILKSNGITEGMEIDKINLRALEGVLKNDQWIANAELFLDNKQVLKVLVQEKEPVARMFTPEGSSFYIDSSCRRLPLSQKLSARIPMFTGFPSDRVVLSKPDSTLLGSAKELAVFIQGDDFWKAQVAQIDITPDGFEMIPTVGNHIVLLGKDDHFQEKFDRLYSFYKQVWTKVGFEAYEKLDVRFDGQVVATVKGAKTRAIVDSAKAIQAMENLVAQDKSDTVDENSSNAKVAVIPHAIIKKDTVTNKPVARPKPIAVMPKPVNNVLLKANSKLVSAVGVPNKHELTDVEEKIKNEAIVQSRLHNAKAKMKNSLVLKPPVKKVVKAKGDNIKVQH